MGDKCKKATGIEQMRFVGKNCEIVFTKDYNISMGR